jgi:pilus assembly protein Flp/PilA
MKALLGRFLEDESGATAVEYGIMVALIAAAIIITVGLLGDALDSVFGYVELHTAITP